MVNTKLPRVKKQKLPSPPKNASASMTIWEAEKPIDRIHHPDFTAAQFNPGKGHARFSPMKDQNGAFVPTIYGGENVGVALMETLLHNLPTPCGGYPVEMSELQKLAHSQLVPTQNLALVDLNPRV
ncbi:RES family NAD+ phosphorylase [Erwiniaceae bacterium BAC15a-03b]|uniref:RES family NAD+ phosphorylase n=1 Tax=Winslowiella arboricola TaxID=2978220 RepID=A0A9J6PJ99_9GAMM|nr:RES family NAD+ phosphorylase [Winslowiella arboricola]MCU5773700.1 RES family NAD+ phosphorylase [Winslowiella arboricola]MCU5778401.1 RES family NAD+ phosphorylase [Winslowiella arboricola]